MSDRHLQQITQSLHHMQRHLSINDPATKQIELNLALLTAPPVLSVSRSYKVVKAMMLRETEEPFAHTSEVNLTGTFADDPSLRDLPLNLVKFRNASVTIGGYLVSESGEIYVDNIQFTNPGWEDGHEHPDFYNDLPIRSFDRTDRSGMAHIDRTEYNEDIFLFNIRNAQVNLGHFFLDFLIQLKAFRIAEELNSSIVAYVPATFKYPIQEYLLEVFFERAIREGRMRRQTRLGSYKSVTVSSPQFPPVANEIGSESAKFCQGELAKLSSTVQSRLGVATPEKIFVSRKDWTSNAYNRNSTNESYLQEYFEKRGFVTVVNSEMSPEQQVSFYSNARIVAGIHGAGLLNILFSNNPNAWLIEIDAEIPTWRAIERFIRGVGFRHSLLRPDVKQGILDYDWALQAIENLAAS